MAPRYFDLLDADGVARSYARRRTFSSAVEKRRFIAAIQEQSPILDTVGGVRLLVVMADDKKSVRVFEVSVDGRDLEFYIKPDVKALRLVDQETGSEWDFSGLCLSGPLTGRRLKKVDVLTEYWFDWKNYHPATTVYNLRLG